MTRPDQHGGGEAAPPIAGDTSSFPSDAELSRTLIASKHNATLCTTTADGFPYGSLVSYATGDDGFPVLLISEMAEHTVNARLDARASILVSEGENEGDPLSRARLTLVGHLELLDDPGPLRDRYLERHPYAAFYVDFTDFGFWRLNVVRARYVGGFGHMSWVDGDGFADASSDLLVDSAEGIIEHMNDDHSDANLLYAQVIAGLADATSAEMTDVDRYGMTLQVDTPAGKRTARVPFLEPLTAADQAQPAVIALLKHAREQLANT